MQGGCVKSDDSFLCYKWITVVGLIFIQLTLGTPFYWGNMSVYVMSYQIEYGDHNSTDVNAPWVVCLVTLGSNIAFQLSAILIKRIGERFTILVGLVLCEVGAFGAYFTLQKSPMLLYFLFGFFPSLGRSLTYAASLSILVGWATDDFGILMSIIESSFTIGAIFVNQLITRYVNPDNLPPDKIIDSSHFFFQPEVVDKVPDLFWILAAVWIGSFLVGIFMIRKKSEVTSKHIAKNGDVTGRSVENPEDYGSTTKGQGHCNLDDVGNRRGQDQTATSEACDSDNTTPTPANKQRPELSPKQMIREPLCFFLWTFLVIGTFNYMTAVNYYKPFGQIYVRNDHLLTDITIPKLIAMTMGRIFWGFFFDRWDLKLSFVIFFSTNGVCSFLFFFSATLNEWCLATMTVIFGCLATPLYLFLSYSCLKFFGEKHYLSNLAVLLAPSVITAFTFPYIVKAVLNAFGWFGLYTACTCYNLVGLVVIVIIKFVDTRK